MRIRLICFVVVAAGLLAAVNLSMIPWSRHLPYVRKLNAIASASQPNLLFLGNSLLDGHVDERAFAEAARSCDVRFRSINAALGGTQAPEVRLLFSYAEQHHPELQTLVVGTMDFLLTAPDHSRPADLTGNRMVGLNREIPRKAVFDAYHFDGVQRLQILGLRMFPMAAYRANAWRNVELLRRSMSEMGMPKIAANEMGRASDFAALEAASGADFDLQAKEFLGHPYSFNSSFEDVFTKAHENHMRVVIVLMPISPYHRAHFYSRPAWAAYWQALTHLAQGRGVEVVDASDWLPRQAEFVDNLHMSPDGVGIFSQRLGQRLACSDRQPGRF